ncbi:hypothetical protein [Daejeonella sp. H1SJ63]|jgi:hypothetical protein|uniref:hypothetical protein n=1 Tax=Daejeonella sp. H1SJ63 TaxID=3034145 RepID=UPI0023EBDFC7|nr:hypothetical protein [Daejeonella sp. H1SJ63]
MKRPILLYLAICINIFFAACGGNTSLNESEALSVIADYLEAKPEYKTISFKFGEIKFKGEKDQDDLKKYTTLEESGMISMSLLEEKKRFLSKDSNYVYRITLTEKSAPLVISQSGDKAKVKAVNYILDDEKPVNFIKMHEKSVKITVTLKREETEFYPFDKDKTSNSEFITKTYRLKLKKDDGWIVASE